MYQLSRLGAGLALALLAGAAIARSAGVVPLQADPHRNEVGFFDMHVCNWPDQPLFFLAPVTPTWPRSRCSTRRATASGA